MASSPDIEKATSFKNVPLEQPKPSRVTAEKQNHGRGRLVITLGIVLLAAIGLAVGLSVSLSGSKTSDEPSSLENGTGSTDDSKNVFDSSPEDNETNVETVVSSNFPYTKAFVDFVCSIESISESVGLKLCTDTCEPASCCDPFDMDDSCLQDDLESCVNYAKCQGVMGSNDIDPAPTMLAEMCSVEKLAENKTDCQNACSDVECCYSSEENCVASMFLTCLDYAPCQNLRNDSKVPVAPSTLVQDCAFNRTDDMDCEAACKPAACCVGDTDQDDKCLQSDFISCLTYAPCGGLLIPPLNNEVPQAPDNITELCTIENLLGDGYDDCASTCSTGECCTELGDGNCFPSDPLGCLPYAKCALLHLTGGDIPRAPENLTEVCSMENLEQGGVAAAACADACRNALCCVGLDGSDESCADNGNFFVCAEYYPCAALFITGGGLKSPPETTTQDCSAEAVASDNGEACQKACSDGSCCFSIQDSCLVGNADVCIEYLQSGCFRADGWLLVPPPF